MVELADGRRAIGVVYRVVDDPSGRVRVRAVFEPLPDRVRIRFYLQAADDANVGGASVERTFGPEAEPGATPRPIQPSTW